MKIVVESVCDVGVTLRLIPKNGEVMLTRCVSLSKGGSLIVDCHEDEYDLSVTTEFTISNKVY